MSSRAELWAWDQKGLQPVVKLALVAFTREANLKGEFTLKRKELAEMLECSVDTIDRRVKAMIDAELLEVRHETRGGYRANTYRLKIPMEFVSVEPGRKTAASLENESRNLAAPEAKVSRSFAASEAATGAASNKNHLPSNTEIHPDSSQPSLPIAPSGARLDGKKAIELYNDAAKRVGWCAAKGKPSAQRKQAICARLKEHGMEGWIEALAIAETMPFLRGDNDRGWRMDLDYFSRPSGWQKIVEGVHKRVPNLRMVNGGDNHDPGFDYPHANSFGSGAINGRGAGSSTSVQAQIALRYELEERQRTADAGTMHAHQGSGR